MTSVDAPPIDGFGPGWIGKVDVATRQIQQAIVLFFEERDPVVIHTLVACAHQILVDLGDRAGLYGALKPSNVSREFVASVNYPINFMKHADKDPDGRVFAPPLRTFTEDMLMDAVALLTQLNNEIPMEAKIYFGWYAGRHTSEMENPGDHLRHVMETGVSNWPFPEIVKLLKFIELRREGLEALTLVEQGGA